LGANAEVCQRAEHVVRPGYHEVSAADGRTTIAAGLQVLKPPALIDELARVADWQTFDNLKNDWRTIDPRAVLAARVGHWRLRPVTAMTTCPTVGPHGSVLSAAGYEAATRIYYMPAPNLRMPVLPSNPTQNVAQAAAALLSDLLAGFPLMSVSTSQWR
jgi:putative DNA primase/helicase